MAQQKYFECDCGDFDHIMRVSYYEDTPEELYIEVHLRSQPFFCRLWKGIKYIFGYRSRYGDFDEFLWTRIMAKKFANFLDDFFALNQETK